MNRTIYPPLKYRARRYLNRQRGHSFWCRGAIMRFTPHTCPYPVLEDYSAKACQAAGKCGCVLKTKPNA